MGPAALQPAVGSTRFASLFMTKQAVTIYDTTLRDGTQGTGISFSCAG